MLVRTLHPEVKVLDAATGLVDYIASDETLDHYKEVIRANGWRFTHFAKNAPFVDSHDYSSIDRLVGKVVDFKVEDGRLIETVKWATDVPDNRLAQIGWRMTEAGYLKAVSVGFRSVKAVSRWDEDKTGWMEQMQELGMDDTGGVRTIHVEQEQLELSSVIIGANPNATARAYKSGLLTDADIDTLSLEYAVTHRTPAQAATDAADVARARQRQRERFLQRFTRAISGI